MSNMECCRDSEPVSTHVSSLETPGYSMHPGLASIVDEATNVVDVIDNNLTTLYQKNADLQDITQYFSRPISISAGTLATVARSRVYTLNCPLATTLPFLYPNGQTRLAQVAGIRYTAVFTLVVSATPFTQGLMYLSWQYAIAALAAGYERGQYPEAATNLPHVRLDLSSETSVQLRVPFLFQKEFASLTSFSNNPYGVLSLGHLVNYDTPAGSSAPTYNLLFHLEDIELFGANMSNITTTALQSGGLKGNTNNVLNVEQAMDAKPVSTLLGAVGKAASFVGARVPSLAPVLGPTSWLLGKAARVASYFGFSKPQVLDTVKRMNALNSVAECNVDIPSETVVVGPLASNRLGFDNTLTGTQVDEMSIDFVKTRYSQLTIATFSGSDTIGARLAVVPLCPAYLWFRTRTGVQFARPPPKVGSASVASFYPTSLMALSSMFKYWRGTLKFRVTFVKTKFHAGRVQFAIIYNENTLSEANMGTTHSVYVPVISANGVQADGYNFIVNLKDSNVFEFEVPYVSSLPYNGFFNPIGTMTMSVVDPLCTSGAVQSSIQCLIEVCGGSDYEVADYLGPIWPATHQAPSYDPYAVAALSATPFSEPAAQDSVVEFQSGSASQTLTSYTPPMITQNTIGESIGSLKQCIMVPHTYYINNTTTSRLKVNAILTPWWWCASKVPVPAAFTSGSFSGSGFIAQLYNFVRGSTDVHAYSFNSELGSGFPVSMSVTQDRRFGNLSSTSTGTAVDNVDSTAPTLFASTCGALHARLPAFQHVARMNPLSLSGQATWGLSLSSLDTTGAFTNALPHSLYRLVAWIANKTSIRVNVSAGDDAYCHTYIGPVPLALLPAAVPGAVYDPDSIMDASPPP